MIIESFGLACLMCDTEFARQVQRGVFDGHFTATAFAVLLPFPILLLAVTAVRFGTGKLMAPNEGR